jgi:hypothetical protein
MANSDFSSLGATDVFAPAVSRELIRAAPQECASAIPSRDRKGADRLLATCHSPRSPRQKVPSSRQKVFSLEPKVCTFGPKSCQFSTEIHQFSAVLPDF